MCVCVCVGVGAMQRHQTGLSLLADREAERQILSQTGRLTHALAQLLSHSTHSLASLSLSLKAVNLKLAGNFSHSDTAN